MKMAPRFIENVNITFMEKYDCYFYSIHLDFNEGFIQFNFCFADHSVELGVDRTPSMSVFDFNVK